MTQSEHMTDVLLERAAQGDDEAVNELFARYRDQLRRMVDCHLDARMAPRVDPSDVVQEAFIVASESLAEYAKARPMPFYPWLRRLAIQQLIGLQRRHLSAKRRSIDREQPLARLNDSSVHKLARHLLAHMPGPPTAILQSEQQQRVRQALESLEDSQREVLVMHYIEGLSLADVATVLQIAAEAVRMRHFRALKRLRDVLDEHSGST